MSASRIIIVTGANQGIGFEIVRQLAKQEGTIVYLGARSVEKGQEAVAKLHAEGLKSIKLLELDVTSQASVDKAFLSFSSSHSHLDVLVNNAGVGLEGPTTLAYAVDIQVVKDTFEVNYFGTVRTTTAFAPLLQKSTNPVILNVSSGLGSLSNQSKKEDNPFYALQLPGYNASKSALNMYTIALAAHLPQVRVNAISPGYVATNMNNYSGHLTPTQSAEGVIKYGINLDQSGPTGQFLDYSGSKWAW